ncbi:MAG TPA: RecX family transcriptional regulator [Candidatus Saccharimonadales bacterium]|nr:RecX family transcriptional regulator [Candidatus Saccharimonadales bacterium]
MTITAIKAQVKNPDRVSVYIDQAYAFSLSYNQLLDQKIHAGLQIDQTRVDELKRVSDLGKMYERSLMFAMLRPRSQKELRDYFRRKKWDAADAEHILQKLVAKGYVNDVSFARSWVQNRAINKKMSKRKLVLELKQKGISEEVIRGALDGSDFNESTALSELITKKRKLAKYQDQQKLMQYLARQGFGFDDIKQALQDSNLD